MRRSLCFIAICLSGTVRAGELDALPDTEPGFAEEIAAFIKPDNDAAAAKSLLEAHRFACRQLDNPNEEISCRRTDGGALTLVARRYQVTLATASGKVVRVQTSTGLIGP
jgi:hypothetical protein